MEILTKNTKIIKYFAAGLLAYVMEVISLYAFLHIFEFGVTLSVGISYWVGFGAAFLMQRMVFSDGSGRLRGHLLKYFVVVIFNYFFTLLFINLFAYEYVLAARTAALIITTAWNYILYSYYIFGKPGDVKNLYSKVKENTAKMYYCLSNLKEEHRKTLLKLTLLASVAISMIVGAYSAYKATYAQLLPGDELANVYMLGKSGLSNAFNTLDIHTNLLKLPAFFLQSKVGLSVASLARVNIVLTVVTNLLFVFFFTKVLKKRGVIIATLSLALIQANSVLFNLNYVFKTYRNIEIPVILLIVVYLLRYLDGKAKRPHLLLCLLGYSFIISADAYYKYVLSIPILVVVVLTWLRKRITAEQAMVVGGFALAGTMLASVINILIDGLGILNIVFGYQGPSYTIPYDGLFLQLRASSHEVIRLFGGDIFGSIVTYKMLAPLICFVLLIIGIVSGTRILRGSEKDQDAKNELLFLLVPFICMATYIVYNLSGQAKPDEAAARYLIMIPIMGAVLFAHWADNYIGSALRKGVFILTVLVFSVGIPLGVLNSRAEYGVLTAKASAQANYHREIATKLQEDSVSVALAGHWSATAIKALSSNPSLEVASIQNCNEPLVFLTNDEWFKPDGASKSALVIDSSKNAQYWNCNEATLVSMYGRPEKVVKITDPNSVEPTEIWIYGYDARQALKPTTLR